VPSLDWALLTSGGYWFRGAMSGGSVSAVGLGEAAALGASLKSAFYFGKGVVRQTLDSATVALAQVKANLVCTGSPIPIPDFGSLPGSD
jgi:hypothetical protein